jgi:hypothetical protein
VDVGDRMAVLAEARNDGEDSIKEHGDRFGFGANNLHMACVFINTIN